MELSGQAHGKLLLFGEHAVVYGHPALGFTLPLTTRLSWISAERKVDHEYIRLMESLLSHLGPEAQQLWESHHWQVQMTSDVPVGGGLGSSAALTGAAARLLGQGLTPHPSEERLWQMAHQAERLFHGRPSGVDTTLALGRGLTIFDPRGPHTSPCLPCPFALVVGTVPRQSNTRALIQQVHQAYHDPCQPTREGIEALGRIAREAITSLGRGLTDVSAYLGRYALDAHQILKTLGLSTPELDQLLEVGCRAGADGGKLSGAGGGGAWVLFCADGENAKNVARSLREYVREAGKGDKMPLWSYQWTGRDLLEV